MKGIQFGVILIFVSFIFSCNSEPVLEIANSNITNCPNIYEELSHVRIDKIGKSEYKYGMIEGTERVVEIVDNASYTTSYFDYKNGELVAYRGYDRLQEATNSYQDFSYINGQLDRVNIYLYWQKEGETAGLNELSGYYTFTRNEMQKVIETKLYSIEDGEERLTRITEYEWDDCNVIQSQTYDENRTLESTSSFFYDDKVNPSGLTSLPRTFARLSINNSVRTETVNVNTSGSSSGPEVSENTYTYNELGLPTQKRYNELEKVDYSYITD